MLPETRTTTLQNVVRCLLGAFMIGAGTGHLTFARYPFQAQVPDWVPLTKDNVVLQSGIVEISLGLALLFSPRRYRAVLGAGLAVFYVAVFPGNVHQYLDRLPALGLDTDRRRYVRLFFQPVLIGAALWSTGAWPALRRRKSA